MGNKGRDNGQELIGYLKLLNKIRNRFMFYFLDNDEYFFIYPKKKESEKDDNLRKIFQEILINIDSLLNLMKARDDKKRIIEVYKMTIENVINLLENITYSPDAITNTSNFYRDFSKYFTYISYAFILFLGEKILNFLNEFY